MSTTEAALAKLIDAVCPADTKLANAAMPPPTPCHMAAVTWKDARTAQFGALDDLQVMFGEHREKHVKFMGGAARRSSESKVHLQKKRISETCGSAGHQPIGGPWSLMYALLCVVDPSVSLLTTDEQQQCTSTFVERTARSITSHVRGTAAAYRAAVKPPASLQSIVESLHDPMAALSDETANDAALLHVSELLGAALVLRRNEGGGCMVLPPSATGSDPAVLIAWSSIRGGYELITSRREPMSSIRRRLCMEAGINGPPPCTSITLTKLTDLAGRVAAQHLPGGGRVTKERIARAIADAASL